MFKTLFAAAYPFAYDLNDLGRYYVAWEHLMRHWQSVIGDVWLPVAYEMLVSDPQKIGHQIVAHCGLDWEEGMPRLQHTTRGSDYCERRAGAKANTHRVGRPVAPLC